MNKLKINVGGEAKLMSVYEHYDKGMKYFAKLSMDFVGNATNKDYPGVYDAKTNRKHIISGFDPENPQHSHNSLTESSCVVSLPITKKEYISLMNQLDDKFEEEAYIYNDPTDRRPVLRVCGKLEVKLNPDFRAGKIENLRSGLDYSLEDVIKRKRKKHEGNV